jgi:endonuclease/exonuclease/phosphatase family metal-dependent hydrolase
VRIPLKSSGGTVSLRTQMACEFSIMTYNVHSCIGSDGKASPSRIADVIGQAGPDIVALQELDLGLIRTGLTDQAQVIAEQLKMNFHFHPSLKVEKGLYGNAILSRFPMQLILARGLPIYPHHRRFEKRGALWVEIRIHDSRVQVINTHLALHRRERLLQADLLTGPEWLKHPDCHPPALLCGDINALPWSRVVRRFKESLIDIRNKVPGRGLQGTWPSRFPLLRLDYIFASPDVRVKNIRVLNTPLTRIASDHLPFMARIEAHQVRWGGVENEEDSSSRTKLPQYL